MLMLSRKPYETIIIGGNVEVTVIAIEDNKVRIAIQAPDEVIIDRGEIDAAKRGLDGHAVVEAAARRRREERKAMAAARRSFRPVSVPACPDDPQ